MSEHAGTVGSALDDFLALHGLKDEVERIAAARAEAYAAGLAEGRLQARQEMRARFTQALLDMAADDRRAVLIGNSSGPGSLERVA